MRLGSKRAHHAMHWSSVLGLAPSVSVWLRATETVISAALLALVAGLIAGRCESSLQQLLPVTVLPELVL